MRGAVGKPVVVRLNLSKMIKDGDRTDNILIKPGDMIYVPTSFISNLKGFLATVGRLVSVWYTLGGQDILEEGEPFFGPINR